EAEQEEQQRTFGPSAERRGARGCDEHQGVDLEAATLEVVDRLAHREEPAENVGADEAGWGGPARPPLPPGDEPAHQQEAAGDQREDEFGLLTERPAMRASMAGMALP